MTAQAYDYWIQELVDEGVELARYPCPSCEKELHSPIPDAPREYSTLFCCPGCGDKHFRVVDSDARVYLVETTGVQREVTA